MNKMRNYQNEKNVSNKKRNDELFINLNQKRITANRNRCDCLDEIGSRNQNWIKSFHASNVFIWCSDE